MQPGGEERGETLFEEAGVPRDAAFELDFAKFARLLAPLLAFTADEIWESLPGKSEPSVHLTEFPKGDEREGDGFGIGWYGERPTPGVYRDILPAWNDQNLKSLSHQIRSGLFLAHVGRRAVDGHEVEADGVAWLQLEAADVVLAPLGLEIRKLLVGVDVLLLDAREIGGDEVGVVGLFDVDRRDESDGTAGVRHSHPEMAEFVNERGGDRRIHQHGDSVTRNGRRLRRGTISHCCLHAFQLALRTHLADSPFPPYGRTSLSAPKSVLCRRLAWFTDYMSVHYRLSRPRLAA